MKEYDVIFKYATRARPKKFKNTLNRYYKKMSGKLSYKFIISMDSDDKQMNNDNMKSFLDGFEDLEYFYGNSKNKIQAINADFPPKDINWKILVVVSDDMIPVKRYFDLVIFNNMKDHFPKFDGALHFNDGRQSHLMTLSIMGKKLYDKLGYIYHPDYVSVWCDNEFQQVTKRMNKYVYINKIIIKHDWHQDELVRKNEVYYRRDQKTFNLRKKHGFPSQSIYKGSRFRPPQRQTASIRRSLRRASVRRTVPIPINKLNKPQRRLSL